MRKKTISLLVVLSFLLTLFPMALPAMAVDYKRVSSVETVSDDAVVELNSVRAEFAKGELKGDGKSSVIISLPSDFEFNKVIPTNNPDGRELKWAPTAEAWNTGANKISLKYDDTTGTVISNWNVDVLDDNEIKLTVNETIDDTKKVLLNIDLGAIYVDDGHEGDIELTFDVASGGFDEGSIVVGRVTDGEVEVKVVDDSNFSDKGDVTLRIKEDRAGALEKDPKSVKITLPKGFEWESVNGQVYADSSKDVWLVDGDISEVGNGKFKVETDEDELILNVGSQTSNKAAYIEIKATINVEDETKAKFGDVIAKVGGESDVAPDTIVVGTYGDYDVTVTAADPTTVYAGMLEQEIADITLDEGIKGSLVDKRTVTLTLPEWAKWGSLDSSYSDGSKAKLVLDSFPGKDGQVAKFTVENDDKGRSEIDLEDLEVVLSPDAPEGALEVEVAGSAAVKATVKVAEVKKPVDVKVSSSPVIGIGKADQAIGEITLTEAEGELIKEGEYLTIELPKDVDWDDYDVEVTAGDLEVGRVTDKDNILSIKIDRESDEASTIKVTGSVTAYRSVPEGRVTAEIGGTAVIEVNDEAALTGTDGYYETDANDDIVISNKVAIEENEYDGGLFEDDETIAKVEVANVGTPAPGDQKINAVFTLGSTTFTLNGEEQTMDVAPYAKNGRTYLPMRYVAKALGIKDSGILWKAGTATFISANKVVSVKLGSTTMTLNGAPVPMDVAPEIVSGRTMIPIKWIATAFDVNVTWDAATQQVTVN